jgi:hypothetical protein
MICPLWIGSGLKIKLVEALAFGKATVASPVAAQGCESGIDRAFLLARGPADFVEPLVDLLSRPDRRRRLENGAVDFAREHFAPARVWAELDSILAQRFSTSASAPISPTPLKGVDDCRLLPERTTYVPPNWNKDARAPRPGLASDTIVESLLIPRIIHQTWPARTIPFDFLGFVDSWRRFHPQWEYRLWSDDDIHRFIAKHYPDFLGQFDAYSDPIRRAGAVRYFLLHHFGGLFVDLDVRARAAIDPLLAGKSCVAARSRQSRARDDSRLIGNAILAAVPRHPLPATVIRRLPEFRHRPDALSSTGALMLTQVFDAFQQPETVYLAPTEQLDPLTPEQAERYRRSGDTAVDLSAAVAVQFHHRALHEPIRAAA